MNIAIKIIQQLRNTSSSNEKVQILKDNNDNKTLKELLYYCYNSNLQFGFSEKKLREAIKDYETQFVLTFKEYKEMFDTLAASNINDKLRNMTYEFISLFDEDIQDLLICVLTKDIRIGCNSKSINKAIKGLIPEFGVMLAESYFKQKEGFLKGKEFILTTKLDGNRLVAIKNKDEVIFKTRQGKVMEGLIELEKDFEDIPNGIVLDGELILKNYDNLPSDELFRETMKVARKKGEKRNLEFHIFDCVTLDGFNKGYDPTPCKERKIKAYSLINNKKWLKHVPTLYIGNDENKIMELLEEATDNNQEGIMINIANAGYSCKRSKDILKVKKMTSYDLKIVGFEEGEGNFKGMLGAALVDLRGENIVGVGSGWTVEDRKEIWNNQDKYLGRILEVQFFEESVDSKTGLSSLRFPVAKMIRELGKEVSYE